MEDGQRAEAVCGIHSKSSGRMGNSKRVKNKVSCTGIKNFGKSRGARVLCLLYSLLLCICLTAQAVPVRAAQAALPVGQAAVTFSELNASEVFLKQSQARVCTLTASTMMIRRAAMLSGNTDWRQITEKSVRKYAWTEKAGLKWNFTAAGITVAQKTLSSKSELIGLLDKHPEGVVIYNTKKPHAILVTDYTNGILYCSDPSNDKPSGRYPITQASITVESAGRCWYVKKPVDLKVIHTDADDLLAAGGDADTSGTGLDAGGDADTSGIGLGTGGLDTSGTGLGAGGLDTSGTGLDAGGSNISGTDSVEANTDPGSTDRVDVGTDLAEPGYVASDAGADTGLNTNQKVGNLMYRVLDKDAKTAACTGRAKKVSVVTIPAAVEIAGVRYRVVQVAEGAFAGSNDLKEISVGANVMQIEPKAFYRCKKLQKVTIYAANLQNIGKDAFAYIHKKAKLLMVGDQMEVFAKLLTGTSVPVTATVAVQAERSAKDGAKRV